MQCMILSLHTKGSFDSCTNAMAISAWLAINSTASNPATHNWHKGTHVIYCLKISKNGQVETTYLELHGQLDKHKLF